ncbi:MAG: DUF2818 family protein [Gammaproteobacteria bacterium]|nr:DUF2818 family protein [Gammaproteobacteria bacterium]
MNNDFIIWSLLALALVAANAPFINNRLFFFFVLDAGAEKKAGYRLLEVLVLYFVVGLIGLLLESKINGQIHAQDWEFYAVTFFMFLVFAVPGFIYRYTFHK